jgi:hypothetical protein
MVAKPTLWAGVALLEPLPTVSEQGGDLLPQLLEGKTVITHTQIIPSDPLQIEAGHICLADIGHHLSRVYRWNGAPASAFSVAEHCLHCQRLARAMESPVSARLQLLALLHDAHEAYLGDVIKPIKNQLGPIYGVWARHIDRMVCARLAIREPDETEGKWVSMIDAEAARIECWSLFHPALAVDLCGAPEKVAPIQFYPDHGRAAWIEAVEDAVDLAAIEAAAGCEHRRTVGTTCCA